MITVKALRIHTFKINMDNFTKINSKSTIKLLTIIKGLTNKTVLFKYKNKIHINLMEAQCSLISNLINSWIK